MIPGNPIELATAKKPGRFGFLRDVAPRNLWAAFVLLVVGLTLTLLAAYYIRINIETSAKNEFEFICNEIRLNISDRLSSSALVLYSGSAFFDSSDFVSRTEWRKFTSGLRIDQQMPGTQGIGFALLIPPNQLEQHIQQVRSEGYPNYTVYPRGKREVYSSIIYLEPFTGRNLRAFGYDMFSEPTRREAMERARDGNTAALSGKVTLVQETNEDIQAGTLMYVPVYRHGMPVNTLEERRAGIIGWVYSPYRMTDMMRGTLEKYELKESSRSIVLQIYDGDKISPDTLLYDSRKNQESAAPVPPSDLTQTIQVNSFGRLWTLKFTQLGGLASLANYVSFWLVLVGGTSISLLLFGLAISLLRTAHYLASIRLLADTDSLTGVYNRRKIIELAEIEFARARRQKRVLTILMIDLNFFKQINDTYGHMVGDQALHLTAQSMQNTIRKNVDRVGRYGGDEFIIILPEISLKQAEQVMSRLQANVALDTQDLADDLPPVSLSIGAAELADSVKSSDEMIEWADRVMYMEKKSRKELPHDPDCEDA